MPTKQVTIVGIMSWPDEPTTPPEGGGPPGVWPGPRPSHPIMLPGMPGWGSGGPRPPVDPGYSPPWAQVPPGGGGGQPPHPWYPTFPTNPIQLPPWAGGWQPRPDQGLPTPQPPTGGAGPRPPVDPGYSPPWAQVPPGGGGGWPGGGQPPTAPAFVPIGTGPGGYQWFWSEVYGWMLGVMPPGGSPPAKPDNTLPPEGTGGTPPTTPPPTPDNTLPPEGGTPV